MLGINNFLSSEWMLCGRASTRRVNRGLIDVMIFGGGPCHTKYPGWKMRKAKKKLVSLQAPKSKLEGPAPIGRSVPFFFELNFRPGRSRNSW